MTNLSIYYSFKDKPIVSYLPNSLIEAVRSVQKNVDLMYLLQLQTKQLQKAISKKIVNKEIPTLVGNHLLVPTAIKEISLSRQQITNNKELPTIIAGANLIQNKYNTVTANKGADINVDKNVYLNKFLINSLVENRLSDIQNTTNKQDVWDAVSLKPEQNGVSAFTEMPLQKEVSIKNRSEIALNHYKVNSEMQGKEMSLQTAGLGNAQNSVLHLTKHATETNIDAERNKMPMLVNSAVANINVGKSFAEIKGRCANTNLNTTLLPLHVQPISIVRKTDDVRNSWFVRMPEAENTNTKKDAFMPAPLNTNYEKGTENRKTGVVNIHLNAPLIGNFTIATTTAKGDGLGDFKRKVEEVLIDILNSANVK